MALSPTDEFCEWLRHELGQLALSAANEAVRLEIPVEDFPRSSAMCLAEAILGVVGGVDDESLREEVAIIVDLTLHIDDEDEDDALAVTKPQGTA